MPLPITLKEVDFDSIGFFSERLQLVLMSPRLPVIIDLSSIKFCEPEQFAIIALVLKDFKNKKNFTVEFKIGEQKPISKVIGYLSHVGFFDFLGLNYGNLIGSARGSNTYIPISEISESHLFNTYSEYKATLQDFIEEEAQKLTRILLKSSERTQNFLIITYSIREAIRNALEHSETGVCYVCAQSWNNGKAQIIIMDEGIGIYKSLQQANIKNLDNNNFLRLAIEPGVSRTNNLSALENIHDNSGYGLYVLYHVARSFGRLVISSSQKYLVVTKDKKEFEGSFSHTGTLIALTFESYPNDSRDIINMIVQSGEEEAAAQGRNKSSVRSKSL